MGISHGLCQTGTFKNNVLTKDAKESFEIGCLSTKKAKIRHYPCIDCGCASASTEIDLPGALKDPHPTGTLTCSDKKVWSMAPSPPPSYKMKCKDEVAVLLGVFLGIALLVCCIYLCYRTCVVHEADGGSSRETEVAMASAGEPGCIDGV